MIALVTLLAVAQPTCTSTLAGGLLILPRAHYDKTLTELSRAQRSAGHFKVELEKCEDASADLETELAGVKDERDDLRRDLTENPTPSTTTATTAEGSVVNAEAISRLAGAGVVAAVSAVGGDRLCGEFCAGGGALLGVLAGAMLVVIADYVITEVVGWFE